MSSKDYSTRLVWMKRTGTKDVLGSGGMEYEWPDFKELWGSVNEISATKLIYLGSLGSLTDAEIRVRNCPAISPVDQIRNKVTGEVYVIDGIIQGDNELRIACHKEKVRE